MVAALTSIVCASAAHSAIASFNVGSARRRSKQRTPKRMAKIERTTVTDFRVSRVPVANYAEYGDYGAGMDYEGED